MEGDTDLFASSNLFSAFQDTCVGSRTLNATENSSSSNKSGDLHLNGDAGGDESCILEVESSEHEELIVLDETGSSDSENDHNEQNVLVNKRRASADDQDIQIIESEIPSVESEHFNPLEITLEDDPSCNKISSPCHTCHHKVEISRLSKENASLRQQLALQDASYCVIKNAELGIEIRFLKPSSMRKYKQLFEDYIKTVLIAGDSVKEVKPVESEVFTDFCIDKTASFESRPSTSSSGVWKVPKYDQSAKDVLQADEIVEVDSELTPSIIPKSTCFNCLGDHMIANCPKEKDRKRIAENREAFLNKTGNKAGRYHADEDVRFSKFKPGKISGALRKALGLSKHDVPFYIYKMRLLGYPPGWLKEAEVTSSGLAVYDSEGKVVCEDNIEDGEVETSEVRVQHNPEKLIEFPGFNVFLPYGFRDECAKFGFPPIQDCHLKHNLEKYMKAPEIQPYKRKISISATNGKKTKLNESDANCEDMDMEIEEINLEDKNSVSKPPESLNESSNDSISEIDMCGSPSLEELEQVKKNLLDVLSTNSSSLAISCDTNGSLSQESQSEIEGDNIASTSNASASIGSQQKSTDSSSLPNTPSRQNNSTELQASASKSVELGSPSIIKACKVSLPSREMFSVGITEHIPFENLPGATGQFERLRGVLKTIRNAKS